MTDPLEHQKDLASEHVSTAWPLLQEQVRSLPRYAGIERIILCGCGDSHHASLGLAMGFSVIAKVRCQPSFSMNAARYLIPGYGEAPGKTLVIAISASGEVARTIEAIEIANHTGLDTLAFTGNQAGTLAQTANHAIIFPGPVIPHGPGLISYLSSLLMGYALMHHIGAEAMRVRLDRAMDELFGLMDEWINDRWERGLRFAGAAEEGLCVFLGSGPAYGSALFSAAKLLEASGEHAWGQDVEEWAHLEYFDAHESMRTWLLSANGRSRTRELEVRQAAHAIGRTWHEDRYDGLTSNHGELNEVLAPLVLWAGPSAYASRRTAINQEIPFRNFGGGRDQEEGGGASRIRSSQRLISFDRE